MQRLVKDIHAFYKTETGKPVICEKITPYFQTSKVVKESLKELFPMAKILYLHRDGRDVAVSGIFDWLMKRSDGEELNEFKLRRYNKLVHHEKSIRLNRFFEDEEIATWAEYWRDPISHLLGESDFQISYENLTNNIQKELKSLFSFMDISSENSLIKQCINQCSFQRMSGGRQPGEEVKTAKVRKGIVGDWLNYFTTKDGDIFHQVAGDELFELGYETDKNWYENLPFSREI